jgi:signal transduction histidine kinase
MVTPEQFLADGFPAEQSLITPGAADERNGSAGMTSISVSEWAALVRYLESQLDESRAAVARILHDELGGALVAAKINLRNLERALDGRAQELTGPAMQAQRDLDHAITTGRHLVESLQPGLLVHIGLFAAARCYLGTLRASDGSCIRATLPDEEVPVVLPRRIVLYRAIQEAASYVCKAAGAGAVSVAVTASAETITLRFAPFALPTQPSLDPQLLALRHRLLTVGGAMDFLNRGDSALVIRAPVIATVP